VVHGEGDDTLGLGLTDDILGQFGDDLGGRRDRPGSEG
jgi:hypothetical protein